MILQPAAKGRARLGGKQQSGALIKAYPATFETDCAGLVPEYDEALRTAADPIRRSQAVELGGKMLSPSMTRDQAAEAIQGMTQAEREALGQGVRSRIDDLMANVSRTAADGDTGAREALKGLKDLSSRANREKMALVLGDEKAGRLFQEVDRVAQSFDLRASVADNSRTYARQAMDQRVKDMTAPGVFGKAAQGEPVNAVKRIVQALTGQTPERQTAKQDEIYKQLAEIMTRRGGAGQGVYDAISSLGKTDAKTARVRDRIQRAFMGVSRSYPATALIENKIRE